MIYTYIFSLIIAGINIFVCKQEEKHSTEQVQIRKVKDVVIYEDAKYHATFPSAVKMGTNNYIVAFRRAPDRRKFGEGGNAHVDPNSYLVQVRSQDGENWTKDPELIYSHPFGGSQDPCLLKLRDGTLLCASYGWAFSSQEGIDNLKKPILHESWHGGEVAFLGGYIVRSFDKGKTWEGPIYPPHIKSDIYCDAMGEPLPAYNRGALCEGKNGKIYWIVATHDSVPLGKTSNHLLYSEDKGETWHYSGLVASDDKASFNEASVYETPKGDLIGFLRTANMDDHACIARSTDGGKTFKWESMGFQGHPLATVRLPDNRVLVTYGYRHKPYGIRARVLNAECTDYATSEEFILRDDGYGPDLGYPWPVLLENNRVLVVYYFNTDGNRNIEGTILEVERTINELYLNTAPGKKVILDVDMCTDVDDVCAVRIATAFDDEGVIDLKGVAYSVTGKNNLDALRGFLLFENKPGVLIGKSSVDIPDESPYWDLMCEYSDGSVNAYDAVKMYRKILAESDTYVDIITTGYVTNVEKLLKSEADEYSGLTGLELVKKKCGQLYIAGGTYPEGRCNNFFFEKGARMAIDYVSRNWPYPILFFTNEVGGRLTCGAQLQAVDKENKDIVTRSLVAFGTQNGRHAWDPFGVWCAGLACGEINKLGFKRVNLKIDTETGYNKFTDAIDGKHFVIYRLCDDDNYYNTMMDNLLIKKAKM